MDKPVIDVRPESYIYAAVLLLILPLQWVLSALTAGTFHEFCHYLALRMCGGKVWRVQVGVSGTVMDTQPLSPRKELICALAGPIGSLTLALSIRWFPLLAICGLVQGVFNLFPVYPLDGGRALHCAMTLIFSQKGDYIAKWVEIVFLLLLLSFAICMIFRYHMGIPTLAVASILLYKVVKRKIPCKDSVMRVQ